MPSLSLEDQLFVLQGDPINDYDFAKGRAVDIWIAPLTFNQSKPATQILYLDNNIVLGDTSMNVRFAAAPTGSAQTLYRNDVIRFGSGYFIVKTTTTVAPHASTATAVPIFAAGFAVTAPLTTRFYNTMIPFISAKEGAFTSASASYAESHNKNMGLYAVSQKIREDYTATITGDVNYGDPCLQLLEDMKVSGLSKLFVQARYTVAFGIGGSFYGDGVLGEQYSGNVALSMSDTEAGMVAISIEVKVSGKRETYTVLALT